MTSTLIRPVEFVSSIAGSRRGGYHTEGDVLVDRTADGVDLNTLWGEYTDSLEIYNRRMATLIALMTYPVTQLIERVVQVGEVEFEAASEFGVPRSERIGVDYFEMAYGFEDYDAATRYTWKYLRDADQRAVDALHQAFIDGDRRLVFRKIMEAIFDNRTREAEIRGHNYNVYPLYNGDGTVPPKFKSDTFDGTHNHYMISGSAQIDSDDFEDQYQNIAEHGYGIEQGTTFIWLGNRSQINEIKKWRVGQTNLNGAVANYDFIPAAGEPTMILPNSDGLLGDRPPASYGGMNVVGSYRGVLIIEESYIPNGYSIMLGSGGEGKLQNPVGLREHVNPAYRGLRLLPGNQQRYPLVDSYYARAFGTGIRQRAGCCVMQYKTEGVYDIPAEYTRGGGFR